MDYLGLSKSTIGAMYVFKAYKNQDKTEDKEGKFKKIFNGFISVVMNLDKLVAFTHNTAALLGVDIPKLLGGK